MIRLALLASGTGTNAENIIRYFSGHALITVGLVVTNNPDAKVLHKAARHRVPALVFERTVWKNPQPVLDALQQHQIDYIILAGFLLMIPMPLLDAYPNKILNIHPALLPDFGGKGMYGDRVHSAVIASGNPVSGITIHLVNEHYDEGKILFQASCPVLSDDTPETLAKRIHDLEYRHFPKVIEHYIFPERRKNPPED